MRIYLSVFLALLFHETFCQSIAFPGAEGYGKSASGGRGGNVVYVTTLQDNGSTSLTGSLRWALNQSSPKIILFKVSGTIFLQSNLSIGKGNVTIAGQSAPGDGICIAGYPITISSDNVIIRYLRFRMGDDLDTNADGADALGARNRKNVIIDHCSMCWSTDECVSIYENENTTVQWCIVSEPLRLSGHSKGPHGYGGIWGGKYASFHHNLIAHSDSRTPRLGPGVSTQLNEYVDMRNNVIYNWSGNGCYGGEAMHINIVNNYFKPGPATPSGSKRGRIYAVDKKTGLSSSDGFYPINNIWGEYFISGNCIDASTSSGSDVTVCNNATNHNWDYGVYNQISGSYGITTNEKIAMKMNSPFDYGDVSTHPAQTAYEKVLSYAGCCQSRDELDLRIINETINGTAAFKGLSPYNGLGSVTYPAGTVIGSTTLTVETTINWKSTDYPKYGIIDSQEDIKPAGASETWSPWPNLQSAPAPDDSDLDGIPDDWENNHGLNPFLSSDGKLYTLDASYTNVEVYLNSLVESITLNQYLGSTTGVQSPVRNAEPIQIIRSTTNVSIYSDKIIHRIEVLGIGGCAMRTINVNSNEYSLSTNCIPHGIYLLKVIFKDGSKTTERLICR